MFSALVNADRFGRHFFVSQRAICNWALENLQLSNQDSARLQAVREEFAVRSDLLRLAHSSVKINIGNAPVSLDGEHHFRIGHKKLMTGQYLSTKTSFVVEDIMTDCVLYEFILKEAQKIPNIPSYSFDPIHGGGERTCDVFISEIAKKRIVVCIVDRDSMAPMGPKSNVANNVITCHSRMNLEDFSGNRSFIGLGTITVGRKLENHIPYHLIRLLPQYRAYPHSAELDGIVCQNEATQAEECFWQFFDVKKGLSGIQVKQLWVNGTLSMDAIQWICGKIGCEVTEIEGKRLKGFGDRVIQAFSQNHEALSGFHEFVRSNYWRCVYGNFFEILLWYFAAPKPVRT